MKSTRSRSRSKNNRNRSNNNGGGNVVNRVFDSSGPEGKVRGTPQQIIDKYNQLARDSQLANDRVATETFQQHAEHYLRLLSAAQREIDARREEQERINRERQAERDREREERQGQKEAQQQSENPAGAVEEGNEASGLVDTPEGQKKRPSKPVITAGDPQPDVSFEMDPAAAPQPMQENASKPKRTPRARRKPAESAGGEGSQQVEVASDPSAAAE